MGLAAGKVLERRPPARRLQDAQVDLQPLVGAYGGLGGAAEEHLGHLEEFAETGHHPASGLRTVRLGILGRHQQVQVTNGLPHAAQAAGRGSPHHAWHLLQGIQHDVSQRPGYAQ